MRRSHGSGLPRKFFLGVVGVVLAACALLAPVTTAADGERRFTGGSVLAAGPGLPPPDTAVLRAKRARGYLVRDGAAYDAAKAAATARPGRDGPARPGGPLASTIGLSFQGVNDTGVTPPDNNGAVGTTRYVELINRMYAIYDKSGNLQESGTLATFTGISGTSLFDVQVIWDPDTSRFYYVMDDVEAGGNFLAFGFSKTDSPSGAADFCHFKADFLYGTDFPDYPKLGTTDNFLVIGVNTFDVNDSYIGSDILTITKPGAGTTCPSPGTFSINAAFSVENQGGTTLAWTPVPAVQTDPNATGWVVSTTEAITDNELTLFQVSGSAPTSVIESIGRSVPTTMYTAPPNASQSGTTKVLDTLDGRNTQAIAGVNPSTPGSPHVIWTQHAVDNGTSPTGRSQVRWYQINPRPGSTPLVYDERTISDSSLHVFNGAVSPDRRVNGSGRAFGNASAMVFNTSSSSTFPALYAQTKTFMGNPSPWLLIRQSPGFNQDFSCDTAGEPTCRWGDYAAATPDPAASTARLHGVVWFTNQWNVASGSVGDVDWRTQNGRIDVDESYGFLRVTSSPAVPTQILVDGNIMDNWGLAWVKVPVGSHTVSFTDVEGYTTPSDQVVSVTEGNTTTVTGSFTQRGLLRVLTSPAQPGTITVAGARRNDWGLWTWFPTGSYQVCYGNVVDWLPPVCDNVNLTAGNQTTVTGTYTSSPGAAGESGLGFLRVTTSPPVPSQILRGGTINDSWGLAWEKVTPGMYGIGFTDVEGYTTPADQVVSVTNGNTTTVSGTFVQRGLLRVLTSPAVAATVYVDGVPRNDWGVWTWFPIGTHTVCFANAVGFTAPPCQSVTLTAGTQMTVTGTFATNS